MENVQENLNNINDEYMPSNVATEIELETSDSKTTPTLNTKECKYMGNFETSDYKNGALFNEQNYCWSQTVGEIEIHIRLPKEIQLGKHLSVEITSSNLKVTSRIPIANKLIIEGEFCGKCKATEAMWTITSGNKLTITLDKQKEIWWKRLLMNETEIDLNKIDCSRPIGELSEETQSEINRIQFDEQQKLKGESTSEQIQQQEMLRKAWNAEGSPFKGMPFDPNIVQFQNNT